MNIFEEFKQKAVQGDTKGNARLLYELVANHSNAISHYGMARGMPCDMYRLAPAKPLSPYMLLQVTTEKDGSNHISLQGSGKYLQYKNLEQQEEFLKLLENF